MYGYYADGPYALGKQVGYPYYLVVIVLFYFITVSDTS